MEEKTIQELLKRASEVVNKVDDQDLHEMIHRFDYTPASEIKLDINDCMKVYNWLRELELYHKLCGPINKV